LLNSGQIKNPSLVGLVGYEDQKENGKRGGAPPPPLPFLSNALTPLKEKKLESTKDYFLTLSQYLSLPLSFFLSSIPLSLSNKLLFEMYLHCSRKNWSHLYVCSKMERICFCTSE